MNDLKEVKARARALVGDPDGDFATDAYLLPLVNQALEMFAHSLLGTCSPFITLLKVCLNLPQGTTWLAEQQKPDQPLFGLMNPLLVEFKQAGQPDTAYCTATRRDILPNVSPYGSAQIRGMDWEYRSYILYLTSLPYPADIRVRGEFRPPPLIKDTDMIVVHPMMGAALAFGTAALIGSERGNPTYKADYTLAAQNLLDDIESELVRQTQGTASRLGKMSRGRGGRRGWNGTQ